MRKRKWFCRALVLFLAIGILASCTEGNPAVTGSTGPDNVTTTAPENMVVLADQSGSDYVIVVPSYDESMYDIGYRLSQNVYEKTGIRIRVMTDNYAEQEKEILIGKTSRETEDLTDRLDTARSYLLQKIDSKVCIFAVREKSVEEAIEKFSDLYLSESRHELAVPESLNLVFQSDVELLNLSANSFEIVYGTDATSSVTQLKTELSERTGKEWTISPAASAKDGDYQVLIGKTGRSEAAGFQGQCDSALDYRIGVTGNKIVIAAGGRDGIALAVKDFLDCLEDYEFRGELIMAEDDRLSNDYGKENAKELITNISNSPEYVTARDKLDIETVRIYTPSGETGWYYTHHPFVTGFQGKLYAFYSSGRTNEDDCGQRIMMATSSNFTDWNVSVLVDSIQGESSELVCYCKGCYVYDDTLTVFFQSYEYDASVLRQNEDGTSLRPLEEDAVRHQNGTFYLQTKDGVTWSDPISMGTVYGGNLSPVALQSGKLMWAGYGSLSVSSDPSAIGTWENTRLKLDSSSAAPKLITESGFYQTKDGVIYLMSRTNDTCTYVAASFDDGATWTDMYPSKFVDTSNKFEMGTLPNGKYYYLGGISKKRTEIILMTSSDGVRFNTWYYLANDSYTPLKKGLYKTGVYGYMTSYTDSQYLYVIYSLYKESLEILRVPLTQIGCG